MKLYNFADLLQLAKQRDFKAVGSFNLHCLEMLPAYFKAAEKTNSPLMIQISPARRNISAINYWSMPLNRCQRAKMSRPVCISIIVPI